MKRLLVWLALLALCLAPCARAENAEPEFTIPPPGVSMLEKKGGCMEHRFKSPLRTGKRWIMDR